MPGRLLLLLRHAKSESPGGDVSDRERGLTPRGKRAAQAMGHYMAANDLAPDLVLCSPARRTLETWRLVEPELQKSPRFIVDDALYDFGDGDVLLDVLRRRGDGAASVLIVGHNPATGELAKRLAAKGDRKSLARLAEKFPTAALAVLAFDGADWTTTGGGKLKAFVRPKDIMGG